MLRCRLRRTLAQFFPQAHRFSTARRAKDQGQHGVPLSFAELLLARPAAILSIRYFLPHAAGGIQQSKPHLIAAKHQRVFLPYPLYLASLLPTQSAGYSTQNQLCPWALPSSIPQRRVSPAAARSRNSGGLQTGFLPACTVPVGRCSTSRSTRSIIGEAPAYLRSVQTKALPANGRLLPGRLFLFWVQWGIDSFISFMRRHARTLCLCLSGSNYWGIKKAPTKSSTRFSVPIL